MNMKKLSAVSFQRLAHGLTLALALIILLSPISAWAADNPYLEVNGRDGNYSVNRYYIDENIAGQGILAVRFSPNSSQNVVDVEVFTNLNRRDYAKLNDDGSTIMAGSTAPTYFAAYDMTPSGSSWTLNMTVNRTGVYRLTVRYKVQGESTWRWYTSPPTRRDAIVVVSPEKARHLSMYELQVNAIEATGDDFSRRSTFEDLTSADNDGYDKVSVDSLRGMGVNTAWLQPIHPIGSRNEPAPAGQTQDPGSPYAVKNFFEVAEFLSDGNSRASSMQAFRSFVTEADAKGLNIFLDVTFNHAAWDVEIGPAARILWNWTDAENAQLRNIKPQWFSKYDRSRSEPDAFRWWERAQSTGEISCAPADRHDFGKWRDVADFYYGQYSALGNPPSEDDGFWQHDPTVDQLVEYFAYYAKFWIEQTGGGGNPLQSYRGIDGFRCDFAQGLPPQAWEYIINKARSSKWDFVFMAESLDGGAVSRRAAHQFDIVNDNWVWSTENQFNPDGWRTAIEARRAEYGSAMILRNSVTHDHPAPEDPWMAAMRSAVTSAIDGVPLVFMGMERGHKLQSGFKHFTYEYGRHIYNFKRWNEMTSLWINPVAGIPEYYKRVFSARDRSPALQSTNQYFLAQKNGTMHPAIFAVAKYVESGADPASKDMVIALVNMHYWNEQTATFNVNLPGNILGIRADRSYNVVNLASSTPNQNLWAQPRTGRDILDNGIGAWFHGGYGDNARIAQFLKLIDVTTVQPPADTPTVSYRNIQIDGNFRDWIFGDVRALDPHHDQVMLNDGADNGRDLLAIYSAEGERDYFFRADLLDLAFNQENGGMNLLFLLDFKSGGQSSLPNFLSGTTDRQWDVAIVYNNNSDMQIYTPDWRTNPVGHAGAAIHSQQDAVELGIKKDFLRMLGWQNGWTINMQVLSYRDGSNQIADCVPDDRPGDGVVNGSVASNATTGRAKYSAILHANQALNAGHDIANWIWNPDAKTPAGNPSGYRRTLQTSAAYGMPMNYHISGSLAVTMAHAYNADPMKSGAAFVEELKSYVDANQSDKPGKLIAGGGFAEQIMPYFENDPASGFNVNAVATGFKNDVLRSLFNITYPTRVFWTPERVIKGSTFDDILVDNTTGRATGYTSTVIDHITHLAKWYGKSGAWDPYKLYKINGVTSFVIDDFADDKKFWTMDGGLHIGVRERLMEMARHWDQQQVMLVFDDWEAYAGRSFASQSSVNDNPDNWDVTVKWLANHPWIELVTLEDVLDRNWTPTDLGANTNLSNQTYTWLLHAAENSYDNWYYGSPQEASFFNTVPLLLGGRTGWNMNLPNAMRYGDIKTPGTILHETWKRIKNAPQNSLLKLAQFGYVTDIYETAWHDEDNTNKAMNPDGSWVSPDGTWDPISPWALLAHGHARQENAIVNAAYWADGVKRGLVPSTTVSKLEDCDMDGELEYVIHNDKVYAVFENDGGRLVWAFAANPIEGGGVSMVGVPGAYSYFEGEEEGAGGISPERRVSCFKEMNGGGYVNDNYRGSVNTDGTLTFTSSDGKVAKTISLTGTTLRGSYRETVDGPLYIRFGLAPNVLDMIYNAKKNVVVSGGASSGFIEIANSRGGRARLNMESTTLNSTFSDGTPNNANALMTWTNEVSGNGNFTVSLDLVGTQATAGGTEAPSGAAAPIAVAGTIAGNLDGAVIYPNPFIPGDGDAQNGQEMIAGDFTTGIIFDRLTSDVTLTFYTARGQKVAEQRVTTGRAQWDAKSLDGKPVATGVYVAVIKDNAGRGMRTERFAVVR